ncbi:MAG: hypothetical protein M0008_03210 [Actinomycetota bacterium]|nr:hypothetical protein [Actinomycetota bacterium]
MAEKERAKTHFYAKPPADVTNEPVLFGGGETPSGATTGQRQHSDPALVQTPVGTTATAQVEGGTGFKSAARTNTQVVTTRIPTDLLEKVRKFCQERHITFTSFVEVALAEELKKQLIQRWRGIGAFLGAFAGTIEPGVDLFIAEDETFGFAIYADREKIAIVVLAEGDTREKLREELKKLYRT